MSSSRTDLLVEVTMPQMGVSVAEGTIIEWRVGVGERIEAEQTICEISTDKIDTEVPAPVSGVVAEILVDVGATVPVGEVLARIGSEASTPPRSSGVSPSNGVSTPPASNGAPGAGARDAPPKSRHYSPVVRRIAAEHDIDLDSIEGTGRGGRVRKQDVLALVDAAPAPASVSASGGAPVEASVSASGGAPAPPPVEAPLHIESPYRPDPEPDPAAGAAATTPAPGQLSRMRRQIGEHMKRSLDTAAHCTTWIEVDMGRVEAARAALGVTALPFVARATVAALREHPSLNAWLEGERYTLHEAVNLGIAVSLGEDGLIVPVISAAHELSVEGLAARIKDLARRARARELTPDEVRGGTFTITNPGQYGSIMATPIINQPQVAILDLEAVVKRPVVITDAEGNDSIAIRPMTILGMSWDHRALDGALAAQFLATIKRLLEGWSGA